ncbi:putative antigenic cell wall [Diplodia seriata]|uniref:Putative antigenic cell wall n=1 Tax=Diplodia seriata TaxID=420778 RepID=A0A0G2H6X6_9PEZI|nr:putative antigenic cell wall [Diplodia seriata]
MRFSTLAALLFSSAVIAVPIAPTKRSIEERLPTPIESGEEEPVPSGAAAFGEALGAIGDNIKTTNDTLNAYSGGLKGIVQLLEIQSATSDLGDAISNATAIAKATAVLNVADSATVGQMFLQLQPQINSLLDNIKSKEPEFEKAGFGLIDVISLLRSNLEDQKDGAKDLGDATIAILDPSLTSVATPINDEIQAKFDDTIAAYQGKGGLIQIPPGLIGLLDGGDDN